MITAGALVFGSVGYLMTYGGLPDDGHSAYEVADMTGGSVGAVYRALERRRE